MDLNSENGELGVYHDKPDGDEVKINIYDSVTCKICGKLIGYNPYGMCEDCMAGGWEYNEATS